MLVMHLISRPMNGESLCGIDLSVPMKSTCVQSKVINLWRQHQLPVVYPISKAIEYSIDYRICMCKYYLPNTFLYTCFYILCILQYYVVYEEGIFYHENTNVQALCAINYR